MSHHDKTRSLHGDGFPEDDLPEDDAPARDETRDAPTDPSSLIDRQVGHYRVRRVIASGGMGTVFEALQESPRRAVALKVMKQGVASPSALRRFEYEAQILARLRHPHIAQVYEAGVHEDAATGTSVPYFAMEYVPRAKTITEYARDHELGTRDRLALFAQVCEAVYHGHQKGIIHRDLKPSNILVDSAGAPKVIDFGVARATDSDMAVTTLQTDVGQLIGTLQYMSPEQCEADPHDIDTRSDVYALGVVLYELLCEQLPYDLTDVAIYEAARVIREAPPARPSSFDRRLAGDIETIALKALEKERERRYRSAADLGADIGRYLRSEPILARRPSLLYQAGRFARRNRVLVGGVGATLVALIAGLVGIWFMYAEAEEARGAEAAAHTATEQIADFQASQLANLEASMMGVHLRRTILDDRRQVLVDRGMEVGAVETAIEELESTLEGVNFTSVALEALDETVFQRSLEAIESQFEDQPLIRARLLQTLSDTLQSLGLLVRAIEPQENAVAIRQRVLGDAHEDTLESLSNQGILLRRLGRREEAERIYRVALATSRRELGVDHERTIDLMNNLGVLLRKMSQYEEAEKLYREALAVGRQALGSDHSLTLSVMHNLSFLLQSRGDLDEAEELQREVLETRRRVLGDLHPRTLSAINNMGGLYNMKDDLERAEELWMEALEGRRQKLGDEHPHTLNTLNNISVVAMRQKRFEEAERCSREVYETRRRVLGRNHSATLAALGNLAHLMEVLERYEDAERYVRRALEATKLSQGEDSPSVIRFENNLGGLLRNLDRLEEANSYGARAVQAAERSLDGHWRTAIYRTNHARTLQALGRFEDAESALTRAHEEIVSILGPDHLQTHGIVNSLAELYESWEEARPGQGYGHRVEEWRAQLPPNWEDRSQP